MGTCAQNTTGACGGCVGARTLASVTLTLFPLPNSIPNRGALFFCRDPTWVLGEGAVDVNARGGATLGREGGEGAKCAREEG